MNPTDEFLSVVDALNESEIPFAVALHGYSRLTWDEKCRRTPQGFGRYRGPFTA